MESQRFCLKWNSHHLNFIKEFEDLLINQAFVDITLACEGKILKAHKVVLSSCSPFLRQLLLENPCQHPIMLLNEMRYDDIKSILDFIYRGEVNISNSKMSSFLKAAEVLQIKGLFVDSQEIEEFSDKEQEIEESNDKEREIDSFKELSVSTFCPAPKSNNLLTSNKSITTNSIQKKPSAKIPIEINRILHSSESSTDDVNRIAVRVVNSSESLEMFSTRDICETIIPPHDLSTMAVGDSLIVSVTKNKYCPGICNVKQKDMLNESAISNEGWCSPSSDATHLPESNEHFYPFPESLCLTSIADDALETDTKSPHLTSIAKEFSEAFSVSEIKSFDASSSVRLSEKNNWRRTYNRCRLGSQGIIQGSLQSTSLDSAILPEPGTSQVGSSEIAYALHTNHRAQLMKKRRRRPTWLKNLDVRSLASSAHHVMTKVPPGRYSDCVVCSDRVSGRRKRTTFVCMGCGGIGLCPGNCWKELHGQTCNVFLE